MKRSVLALILSALAVTSVLPAASAADTTGYPVYVDNQDTQTDICTMVPLESTAKALGFTVKWDGDTAVVDNGKMHSAITIGKDQYQAITSIEGALGATAPFSLGEAPYRTEDGTVYIPLELFTILLGNNDSVLTLEDGILYYHTATESEAEAEAGAAQLPNPFVDCDTSKEAASVSGVTLTVENPITGYRLTGYRATKNGLTEMLYSNQFDSEEQLSIRKASGQEDISGDYNEYENVTNVAVDGVSVTMKGNGKPIYLATWEQNGYSYSVSSEKGLTQAKMSNIIRNVQ